MALQLSTTPLCATHLRTCSGTLSGSLLSHFQRASCGRGGLLWLQDLLFGALDEKQAAASPDSEQVVLLCCRESRFLWVSRWLLCQGKVSAMEPQR